MDLLITALDLIPTVVVLAICIVALVVLAVAFLIRGADEQCDSCCYLFRSTDLTRVVVTHHLTGRPYPIRVCPGCLPED